MALNICDLIPGGVKKLYYFMFCFWNNTNTFTLASYKIYKKLNYKL